MIRITLMGICLAAATPSFAQSDGERFGDEDRSDTRVPDAAWESRFEGLFAEDGKCADPDSVWAVADSSVDMGRLACLGMGKKTWENGSLVVPLSRCRSEGEARPDMRLAFRKEDDAIVVSGEGVSARLAPCRRGG